MQSSSLLLCSNFSNLVDIKSCKSSTPSTNEVPRSLSKCGSLQFKIAPVNKRISKRNFAVYSTPPETSGIFPFWPPNESSWAWLLGVITLVPLAVQRLLTLSNTVETAVQKVEDAVDAVEKTAERVEKVAEDIAEDLPAGKLKDAVNYIENVADRIDDTTEVIGDVIDKIQEVQDKLESAVESALEGKNEDKAKEIAKEVKTQA